MWVMAFTMVGHYAARSIHNAVHGSIRRFRSACHTHLTTMAAITRMRRIGTFETRGAEMPGVRETTSGRHRHETLVFQCRWNNIIVVQYVVCLRRIRMFSTVAFAIMVWPQARQVVRAEMFPSAVCRRRIRLFGAGVFSIGVCRRRIRLLERWQPQRHRAAGDQVVGRWQSRRPCAAGASGISVCLSPSGGRANKRMVRTSGTRGNFNNVLSVRVRAGIGVCARHQGAPNAAHARR